MICKYQDNNGQALHEGDTVLLDKPGTEAKVIGTVEFYARRGMWAVRVESVFSTAERQFVPVNCGAVSQMISLAPHMRLFSRRLKRVELLKRVQRPARRAWNAPAPSIF